MKVVYIQKEVNDIKGMLKQHKTDANAMRAAFLSYITANKPDYVGHGEEKLNELLTMYRKNGLVGYLNFMGL